MLDESSMIQNDISIHSLRMEGDTAELERLRYICISIHSLRMEGDQIKTYPVTEGEISIHSLRMEGDESLRIK